jgi:signal transduction histidine kinase
MAADTASLSPERFQTFLIALGSGALGMGCVWWLRGNAMAGGMGVGLSMSAAAFWGLSRAGRSKLAAVLIVMALNVVTLSGVSYFGGPSAHAPAFLMVVVMFSGLFVGWRGGTISLVACGLMLFIDGWAGPAPWATGVIAHTRRTITVDWLLALGLSGGLAIIAFHATSAQIEAARRSEEEKQKALFVARAASQAKSSFLANMSHELRTPLTAILGYAELLEEDLEGEQRDDIHRVKGAGRHLLDLIDQVLDVARVESGHLELDRARFHIGDLLDEIVTLVGPSAASAKVELRIVRDELGSGMGDRLRVRQIVQNLLSNAIKYAPGAPVDVRVAWGAGELVVEVKDHGPGIPAGVSPSLYTPVSRGHATSTEGPGLGLALSHALATKMGGTLTASSTDAGACFVLTLPFVDDAFEGQRDAKA